MKHPKFKGKVNADTKLMENLQSMGASINHHHFHNAIIGTDDAEMRYNAKWLDKKRPLVG